MARSVPLVAAVVAALVAGCTSKEPHPGCPSGQERCDGQCIDPATYYVTDGNCGGCGVSCGAGTCSGGACACGGATPTSCPDSNPRCADLQTDPSNCGGCGVTCGTAKPHEGCAGGSCQCVPGSAYPDDCTTYCTNFHADPRNCLGCNQVCPHTNDVCGADGCACPAGLLDVCGSTCVNEQTDASNCGGCGNVCPAGATCSGGSCLCSGTVCGDACIDTSTDEANCGTCDHVCPAGATCSGGSCPCPAGPIAGCEGACCAGGSSSCCGNGACETQHSNGVGQTFFDCAPLGTYGEALALKAAQAWRSSGTLVPGREILCGTQQCIGWRSGGACGTWCYGADAWQGRVTLNTSNEVCLCPPDGSAHWN